METDKKKNKTDFNLFITDKKQWVSGQGRCSTGKWQGRISLKLENRQRAGTSVSDTFINNRNKVRVVARNISLVYTCTRYSFYEYISECKNRWVALIWLDGIKSVEETVKNSLSSQNIWLDFFSQLPKKFLLYSVAVFERKEFLNFKNNLHVQ